MARKIGFGDQRKTESNTAQPASEPVVPARGRRRALLMLVFGVILDGIGIILLMQGYVLAFAVLMVAGVAFFTTGTVAIIQIARGRGL